MQESASFCKQDSGKELSYHVMFAGEGRANLQTWWLEPDLFYMQSTAMPLIKSGNLQLQNPGAFGLISKALCK